MKNQKRLFLINVLVILILLYQYWFLPRLLLGNSVSTLSSLIYFIITIVWVPLLLWDVFLIKMEGLGLKELSLLIKQKTDSFGQLLYFFTIHLYIAYPVNILMFIIGGTEDSKNIALVLNINFYLLAVFAFIGIIKGGLLFRKS